MLIRLSSSYYYSVSVTQILELEQRTPLLSQVSRVPAPTLTETVESAAGLCHQSTTCLETKDICLVAQEQLRLRPLILQPPHPPLPRHQPLQLLLWVVLRASATTQIQHNLAFKTLPTWLHARTAVRAETTSAVSATTASAGQYHSLFQAHRIVSKR